MVSPSGENNDRIFYESEWLTVKEACDFARCSKPLIYTWMSRNLIRNVSLRERGKLKGYRRICAKSLREFLDSHATGGSESSN
jgi:hypothetical protein